jgi:hypothetical protein
LNQPVVGEGMSKPALTHIQIHLYSYTHEHIYSVVRSTCMLGLNGSLRLRAAYRLPPSGPRRCLPRLLHPGTVRIQLHPMRTFPACRHSPSLCHLSSSLYCRWPRMAHLSIIHAFVDVQGRVLWVRL